MFGIMYERCYNRVRSFVTFVRALSGVHSNFRPIGQPVASPDQRLSIIPMANVNYTTPDHGRVVTFDVRNSKGEFVHHVQTEVNAIGRWVIGWHDNKIVFVKSDAARAEAFVVGKSSLVYRLSEPYDDTLLHTIEDLPLPRRRVMPTLSRQSHNSAE